MNKAILLALAAGASVAAAAPAAARDGCGSGYHRDAYGHCRYNRDWQDRRWHRGYDRGYHRGWDRDRRGGAELIIGNYYDGRGYWDGQRYYRHRRHHATGWDYYNY